MRTYVVLRHCGISLLIISVMMILSAFTALAYPSDNSFIPLAAAGTSTLVCGALPVFLTKPVNRIQINEGYTIVLCVWIVAWLFGALPYIMYGGEFRIINALFESMSGFTTTGASILNDIESLPPGLQLWRISTAWIGGIGVVLLITLAIPSERNGQVVLVSSETSSLAREYFKGGKRGYVRTMMLTYTSITLISLFCLKKAGMGWFDALTHAMSACSTCGFSTRNSSIAFYDNPMIETVLIISMLTGAVNFSLLYSTIIPSRYKYSNILRSEVFRVFIILTAAAALCVTVSLRINHVYDDTCQSFRHALFQTVSIATTTGFATADTNVWPSFCIGILIICSIICGCAGSTSGGIKTDRIVLVTKELRYKLHRLCDPSLVEQINIDGRFRKSDEISHAQLFILMYFGLILIGAETNITAGMDLRSGVSAAIACMGNVGPGFGQVSSMGNYADLPDTIKLSCIVLMLAGRLEIYPLFLAFRR